MIRTVPRTLVMVLVAAIWLPAPAVAKPAAAKPEATQPAAAARAEPAIDPLTPQDREVLATANQLAARVSRLFQEWITSKLPQDKFLEDKLFARLYFPEPKAPTDPVKGDPQTYSTPYTQLADANLMGPQGPVDQALAGSPAVVYAIVTDSNGYVAAQDRRLAQPLTGAAAQGHLDDRSKRLLGDLASLLAARSELPYLLQHTRLETGEVIDDLSVPVIVNQKHWGCVRIGYRRNP